MTETVDPLPIDATLAAALPANSLYAVGGRVRDEIRAGIDGRGPQAKDLDYVVLGVELDDLLARLQQVGRADVVGAAFAVIKATVHGTTVDIALPRRERSTGLGHRDFVVEAGPHVPLADDLGRRDFRMNMLARAVPHGRLVDPYGGEADIRARRIDVLRREAFAEDPLRLLRACQFAARFGYAVTPETLAAMREAAPLVATVSAERVRDELIKLLDLAQTPSAGFELMREVGLLAAVLPEVAEGVGVTQNAYHAFDVYQHNLFTMDATPPGNLVLRTAALLHDVGKPWTKTVDPGDPAGAHFYRHEIVGEGMTRDILGRLRFPSDDIERIAGLVRHHMYVADPAFEPRAIRRFVRRVGLAGLPLQFALRAADIVGSGLPKRSGDNERFEERVWAVVAERPALSVRDLALSGTDVINILVAAGRLPLNSRGGREVGTLLARLLDQVTDEPELNEREKLLTLAAGLASKPQLFHGKQDEHPSV